jgi:hypothetical protein
MHADRRRCIGLYLSAVMNRNIVMLENIPALQ